MKLKYLGKGECISEEAATAVVKALDKEGLVVHHKPDYPKQFTIFGKEAEEPKQE